MGVTRLRENLMGRRVHLVGMQEPRQKAAAPPPRYPTPPSHEALDRLSGPLGLGSTAVKVALLSGLRAGIKLERAGDHRAHPKSQTNFRTKTDKLPDKIFFGLGF